MTILTNLSEGKPLTTEQYEKGQLFGLIHGHLSGCCFCVNLKTGVTILAACNMCYALGMLPAAFHAYGPAAISLSTIIYLVVFICSAYGV